VFSVGDIMAYETSAPNRSSLDTSAMWAWSQTSNMTNGRDE